VLWACSQSNNDDVERICDYNKDVTPLYRAIENRQWASVNNFLKTGYWKQSFFKDSVSPEIQVRTWMVRYDEVNGESQVTWKQLPMHAAIIYGAPAIIIQKILKMHPPALQSSDKRGNLPIHLAFRHGSNDAVLALLLQIYPEGMNCREANGLLPTECATDLPSPQPLRGALLRTSMCREGNDHNSIQKKLKAEQFFFDERPITPNEGNSPNSIQLAQSHDHSEDTKDKLSLLSRQVESLRNKVETSLTTPEHAQAIPKRPLHIQVPPIQPQDQTTTPKHELTSATSNASSPNIKTTPQQTTTPLSPTTLEQLEGMVRRVLLASPSSKIGSPNAMEGNSQSSQEIMDESEMIEDSTTEQIVQSTMPNSTRFSVPTPTTTAANRSRRHELQQEPLHHPPSRQPTSSFRKANADTSDPPVHSRSLNTGLAPSPSYNNMKYQHQQHQHQLQQLHRHRKQRDVLHTATFEEQQHQLDLEVRLLEEKMSAMEQVMKEMHKREKTVRRELALTLKEVKHWKAQARRAVTEEEKNRILTEMLHELVPMAATTPRQQNKTPRASDDDDNEDRYSSLRRSQSERKQHRATESPGRPKQVTVKVDDRYFPENHGPAQGRSDLDYPHRHSDVGVYDERVTYNTNVIRDNHLPTSTDAPPAVPLRRMQSEYQSRGGYDIAENIETTAAIAQRSQQRIGVRGDEIREAPPGYAPPIQTTFVDPPSSGRDDRLSSDGDNEDETETGDFSLSLVEKVAALQSAKKKKARSFKHKYAAEHQARRQLEAQAGYSGAGWRARDPEESFPVSQVSPQSRSHVYRVHEKSHRGIVSIPVTTHTSGSYTTSDSSFYPRD
jgi:hypothetical protein